MGLLLDISRTIAGSVVIRWKVVILIDRLGVKDVQVVIAQVAIITGTHVCGVSGPVVLAVQK